jgi:hypothetical protein
MSDIQVGDKVVIIHSPYSDVHNGTAANVTEIWRLPISPNTRLYCLDLPDHKWYWRSELQWLKAEVTA